jgi:acetate kinase
MTILACNAGSTSLKFKLYEVPSETLLAEAKIERVGSNDDAIFSYAHPGRSFKVTKEKQSVPDYTTGIRMFLDFLTARDTGAIAGITEVAAVCFKTVLAKGFYGVHELTDDVMAGMQEYMDIAASHNGPYISVIQQFKALLPGVKMIGVFETHFHQHIPLERLLYGIPYEWYETYGIRRMGYHGASHGYVTGRVSELFGKNHKLIACHLGGSGSICAVHNGTSVDTSFGISLHTGTLHAARTGDVDTCIIPFLQARGFSLDDIMKGLTKKGGLLGLSGVSEDMRYIEQAAAEGNTRAALALDVYCSSLIHYIGAFYADLGGLDCLTFAGGIGENSVIVRQKVCAAIAHFGITLDAQKNSAVGGANGVRETLISAPDSKVRVYVIPTNEEIYIIRKTCEFLQESA